MLPATGVIMRGLPALLIALFVPVAAANAALITVDSPLGPDTIARDTEQGLDWLSLRLTANMSIGEVLAETVPGGRFEGFRYTDSEEFRTLYGPFLACTIVSGYCDNYARMRLFINAIGGDLEGFGGPYKLGMTEIDAGAPRVYADSAFFEFFEEPIPRYSFDSQQLAVPYTRRYEFGHFIVRPTSQVPEPGIAFLIGIGAIALTVMRKSGTAHQEVP